MRGTVKIEWNWDLDDQWFEINEVGRGRFRVKGRCRRCWGGLIGKQVGAGSALTAIRCRVCGLLLEGAAAREEYQRMKKQDGVNMLNMAVGLPLQYRDDATFDQKIFPPLDRQSIDEINQRINAEASKGNKKGWLTRNKFPAGSAGFLFLQARALMAGVERLPRELSAVRFPDFDMHDDGSATVYLPKEELSEHSKTSEYELMKRLGSTMTIAMMSSFACELAMKALRLIRMDEARKSHDLWELFRDLPEDSRARIETDFPEVDSVLKSARHTFAKWRYFEANVGSHGMSSMIGTERAFTLAKAARVLLDEAEMMGLAYEIEVKARKRVTKTDDRQHTHVKQHLVIRGFEAPPR